MNCFKCQPEKIKEMMISTVLNLDMNYKCPILPDITLIIVFECMTMANVASHDISK